MFTLLLILSLAVCLGAFAGPATFSGVSRTVFSNINPQPNTAVGDNALLTYLVPTGQTYLSTTMFFYVDDIAGPSTAAEIVADVAWIKLLVNGVQVSYATGQQWLAILNYYQKNINAVGTGTSGLLTLMYERPWMQGLMSQRGPAYGMAGQNSFQIQIQFSSDPTTTGMQMFHQVDPVLSAIGRHVEVRQQTHTFASTGQDIITDLPKADASPLPSAMVALWLELLGADDSAVKADITNIILQSEDTAIINNVVNVLEWSTMFATAPRTPQEYYFVLDFDYRNRDDGQLWLNMNKFLVMPTFSVEPGTYSLIMEIMTGVANTTTGT